MITAVPRRASVAVAVFSVALWAIVTACIVPTWHDSVTLWRHAVSITPEKPRPVVNLGVSLIGHGPMTEAAQWLEVAELLAVQPNRGWRERETTLKTARLNLAVVVLLQGHPEQAKRLLAQVQAVDPDNPVAAHALALLDAGGL